MSPKMNIGISIRQDAPMPQLMRECREVEDAGFRWIGLADSQLKRREFYVSYTGCALSTSKASIIPVVSVAVTRHPSVVAGAMLSLYELAPGRVILGLGAGDSAIKSIGVNMASVDYLRDYILTIRGLLNGEEVTWQGKRFRAEWRDWNPPVPVKIFVAASGPKTIHMAAGIADGLIGGWGTTESDVRNTKNLVREGALSAGRNPDELELWWCPIANLAESKEAVHRGAGVGFWFYGTLEGKNIPDEYKPAIKRLQEESERQPFRGDRPASERLVDMAKELGVWDWLQARNPGLDGTIADIREGVQRLYDNGIRNVMILPGIGQDKGDFARLMGKEVLPHFS